MGLSKKIRRKLSSGYYVPAAGVETTKNIPVAPTLYPEVVVDRGRQLDKFGVEDRKECCEKNCGVVGATPSVLFALAFGKRIKK